MSRKLINHNDDLKKLKNDGYHLKTQDGYLIIMDIPYLNSDKKIKYGVLISDLTLSGDKTSKPSGHIVWFTGEHPCNTDGSPIEQIRYSNKAQDIAGYKVKQSFSNKPNGGYKDYYQKMTTYINIIFHPAHSEDSSITATPGSSSVQQNTDSVFHYQDTNSSRARIGNISNSLKNQKIAIIGLGGTGSYILDLISKTPVEEINLFDDDIFSTHNAFRTPGAASLEKLRENHKKTDYLKEIYSQMHKKIISHPCNIEQSNFNELSNMSFVFICVDKGTIKKDLFKFLDEQKISFIDVGLGVNVTEDNKLEGNIRVNLCTKDKKDHLIEHVSFSDTQTDEYSTNIQIAELNALNASLAVIKWKKINDFYSDYQKEHTILYQINCNSLINKDRK